MVALLFYIVLMAAVVGGIVWVVDRGGDVTFVWDVWEVSTSTPVLVLAVILFALSAVIGVHFFLWLWRGPRRIRLAMGNRRKEKAIRRSRRDWLPWRQAMRPARAPTPGEPTGCWTGRR